MGWSESSLRQRNSPDLLFLNMFKLRGWWLPCHYMREGREVTQMVTVAERVGAPTTNGTCILKRICIFEKLVLY